LDAAGSRAFPPRRIAVGDLACRRGERVLFSELDFTLGPGEILLLRGPNGAGKTTLLMALAGLFVPEAGLIEIAGRDPEDRPGADIGLLTHLSAIKPRLTLDENLSFWAGLYAVPRAGVAAALDIVGLGPIADLEAGYLSAGQTRRVALARLILSERPIWLMDEPTSALDADGEALVGRLIDAHLDRGGLVVAATHHDLALAETGRAHTLTLGTAA
jgi:heme exporter protein A